MKLNNYTNGNKRIRATEKAFNVVYKRLGFRRADGPQEAPTDNCQSNDDSLNYDNITKDEIISKLEELEVSHAKRDTKRELFDILVSVKE